MIYWELFVSFLRVGLFSFGGAYGAIPLIREEVFRRGWLNDEALSYMIAVSESTPGPIMVNTATYIGSSQAGFFGALLATLAVVLPSFLIILLDGGTEKCHQKSPCSGIAQRTAALRGGHYSGHRYRNGGFQLSARH